MKKPAFRFETLTARQKSYPYEFLAYPYSSKRMARILKRTLGIYQDSTITKNN